MAAVEIAQVDDAGHTRLLAGAALAYRTATLPDAALTVAKQCILDWFGVTLAGATEPCAVLLADELASSGGGPCSVVGRSLRLSAHDAALANGTASHALDFDDVNRRMSGHPTVAVFPAALAVAEEQERSGADTLAAFVAGYEVACMVGALVAPSHYGRGFHATGTVGAIGAAVAAGLLLDLDETAMEHAIGLAATQAAGLKTMFGSMAKPLHAGKAAANGVLAARLAARGFTAQPGGLEADQGFVSTLSNERPKPLCASSPGSEVVATLFKYHAACYLTHSSIDALAFLRDAHELSPETIEQVDLHVPAGHLAVCDIADPANGLETKFSLRHAAALVLCGEDTCAITTYSDEGSADQHLAAVRHRVRVHGDRPNGAAVHVVVRCIGGEVYEREYNTATAIVEYDAQGLRIAEKFLSLATPVIGRAAAARLQTAVAGLDWTPSLHDLLGAARILHGK